jgi:hypothetical protein
MLFKFWLGYFKDKAVGNERGNMSIGRELRYAEHTENASNVDN